MYSMVLVDLDPILFRNTRGSQEEHAPDFFLEELSTILPLFRSSLIKIRYSGQMILSQLHIRSSISFHLTKINVPTIRTRD